MNAPRFQKPIEVINKYDVIIPKELKYRDQDITINNVGESIALNVASTLLVCKSYNSDPGKPRRKTSFRDSRIIWLHIPILPSKGVKCIFINDNGSFQEEN